MDTVFPDATNFPLMMYLFPQKWYLHLIISICAFSFQTAVVFSQSGPDDIETGRTIALGTGLRASQDSTAALLQNPAGLAKKQVYHIGTALGYETDGDRWSVTGSAVDSITTKIAAGFAFRTLFGKKSYTGFDTRLGLATSFLEWFRVGLAGRYLKLSQDKGTNSEKVHTFTLDASMQLEPTPNLHIAALGYNLIPTKSDLAPTRLGGSLSFSLQDSLVLGADFLADLNSFERTTIFVGGGIQYFISGVVPLAAGYSFDSGYKLHRVTGSVGFEYEKFDTDFAFRQQVNEEKETYVLLSFNYHLR